MHCFICCALSRFAKHPRLGGHVQERSTLPRAIPDADWKAQPLFKKHGVSSVCQENLQKWSEGFEAFLDSLPNLYEDWKPMFGPALSSRREVSEVRPATWYIGRLVWRTYRGLKGAPFFANAFVVHTCLENNHSPKVQPKTPQELPDSWTLQLGILVKSNPLTTWVRHLLPRY